jgi:electron transfer flavoprotein alpha subunit
MLIAVCIKQVPKLAEVRFDKRNRIVREDVELMVNPIDLRALGHGLELRGAAGGELVAVTMGPPSAVAALEEMVRRGADRAIHLVDKRFAGADTLATSRALARALLREGPDLVLFGRSSLDGATAQVAPQVAELLDMPQATHVSALSLENGRLRAERETERGAERWTLGLPAIVSVERGPAPPAPEQHREAPIEQVTTEGLGGTPRDYGTRGSPTFVKEVRAVSLQRAVERVHGPAAGADTLMELLSGVKQQPSGKRGPRQKSSRSIWVLAERDGQRLHPTSLEGIACAREVAEQLDAEVVSVLLCAQPGRHPKQLAAHGADRVLVARHGELDEYATAPFASALCATIEAREPYAVIAPWTCQGRDYVPRAAARLGLGLTGDFVRLEVDGGSDEQEPDLLWIKPAWAGTVEAPIITHSAPPIGTLRPGAFQPLDADEEVRASVEVFEPQVGHEEHVSSQERRVEIDDERLLDNAPIVVCVGEELDAGQVALASELAHAMGGSLGASERAVAAGLLAPQLEIGVLKRSMSPLVVLALGVRDEEQLDALRGARRIITVHPDQNAPAHRRADLAISAAPEELVRAALRLIPAAE